VDKSAGVDELGPRLLKELSNDLAGPVAMLFRQSLSEGTVPHAWKRAHKCPAFCLDKQKLAYPSTTSFHWKITTVQGMVHSPHCTHRPLALTNTV